MVGDVPVRIVGVVAVDGKAQPECHCTAQIDRWVTVALLCPPLSRDALTKPVQIAIAIESELHAFPLANNVENART